MKLAYRGLAVLLLASIAGISAYAAWYEYDRARKIAHNDECGRITSQPASLSDLPPCAYELIPPTLREKATGYGGPKLAEGCDQSATTTDCATLAALQAQAERVFPAIPTAAATTTKIIENFLIEIPSDWTVSDLGWEKTPVPGAYLVSIPGGQYMQIYTLPGWLSSLNPDAAYLEDYRHDYPVGATSSRQVFVESAVKTIETRRQVRILSSEDVTINGIPMLRQRYSVGEWSLDAQNNRVFDATSEASVNNELRYVFFDEIAEKFVVLTGWQADDWIDRIAHTIRLIR